MMNRKGQGALEYLLLIGGAVLIAAVVLAIATGLANTGQTAVEGRATDALCSSIPQARCGSFDPDGTGPLAATACKFNTTLKQCVAS